jgi:transcriptional regulator with XRE-family HTH domain
MKKVEILKKIGLKIKKLREERNVSQQDLAAMCNFEKSSMSRLEAGRTNFTVGTLLKICGGLNIKLKDIVDVE